VDHLVDANALAATARACDAVGGALALAEWVGEGRPVTPNGVLRKADIPAASRVLDIESPQRVRNAADVPEEQGRRGASAQDHLAARAPVLLAESASAGVRHARDLHDVIQIAFAWDDDHLHAFRVGHRQYGDPGYDAECDEDKMTVGEVFVRSRGPISYIYDFGESRWHDIVLEDTVEPDLAVSYPVRATGRGDAPIEDGGEDEDEPAWIPFDLADSNAQLAQLAGSARQIAAQLWDDVVVILADAADEAEQATAFLTVLAAEDLLPDARNAAGRAGHCHRADRG
jgi:hypothetical protein